MERKAPKLHLALFHCLAFIIAFPFANAVIASPTPPTKHAEQGIFLVATGNLENTGFQKTVVLLTHSSPRGTTGIAINRSSHIPLSDAFPDINKLQKVGDELFLGGPVHTDGIYVLMKTKRPHAGMFKIATGLYFTRGINAITHGTEKMQPDEQARAYAGYAGWGPGQLKEEIDRGDWTVVHSDPTIVFDNDIDSLWNKLAKVKKEEKRRKGNWI